MKYIYIQYLQKIDNKDMRCITNKRRGKRIEKAISHLVIGKYPQIIIMKQFSLSLH